MCTNGNGDRRSDQVQGSQATKLCHQPASAAPASPKSGRNQTSTVIRSRREQDGLVEVYREHEDTCTGESVPNRS